MAQFIQYLYEYENGQRARNLGFMKVDKQMDKTVIQIYAKQLDDISGIQFQREDGSRYFATWEEEGEQMPPVVSPPIQTPSTNQRPPIQERPQQTMPEITPQQQTPIQQAQPQRPQQMFPQEEEIEEVSAYIPPNTTRYEKIQRQDLSRLPRREWRLANNSFLLHGFYNYHHLLYIEDGDKIWIGVPGIYHEKEKAVANTFGFSEFRRLTDMELELSEEEKNTYDDFGYWCRKVNA